MSRPADLNQLAHRLVAESVGEAERTEGPDEPMRMYRAGRLSSVVLGRDDSEQVTEPDDVMP